jgi:hypothetical protein
MHDTVAIAGPDGFAKAKTTFSPRHIPVSGNAATVLDLEAQVANDSVYFVDGSGVVRRVDAIGAVTTVATFSIDSSYQSISFVVRPDGKRVMAAILTYPKHQPSTDPNQPFGTFSGPWRLQIESANAGGSSTTLHQWQAGTAQYPNGPEGFANIWMAGWDATGPIGLIGQPTATQNAWLSNQRYFAGSLSHINADGTPGSPIGPPNCLPYWRPLAGLFACTPSNPNGTNSVTVADVSGKVYFSGHPPNGQYQTPGDFAISADGTRLAMDGQAVNLGSGATVQLASGFQPQGWLDNQTIIGWLPQNGPAAPHIGVLHLKDPQHPEDWGFTGTFIGLLST